MSDAGATEARAARRPISWQGLTTWRGYAICATPRSGSNYLARLLTSTGALGRPLEYFDRASVLRSGWSDWPADADGQFELILDTASPNGVYGLKVFPQHFDAAHNGWAARLPGLATFIWLRRRDLVGQAISLVRAQQTEAWHALDAPLAEPHFDVEAIDAALGEIVVGDAHWRAWFARNQVNELALDYEELTRAPSAAVDLVTTLLRVPKASIDHGLVDVRPQRDQVTSAWRARYIEARRDLAAF